MSKITILGKDKEGREVRISIVDLDAFIHAPPEASVCVKDNDGQQYMVEKQDLSELEIE